ncbi:DUF2570 domain-containing protein [Yersinia proxima]|uniref:DUF2570 domain-containing protein n=1 Tax=Yersinia proxima TaxID=2890316 RepID=UPI0037D368F2
MPDKITGGFIMALVILILLLVLNKNSLSNQVKKTEKELLEEQSTNRMLENIIDAYQANEAANREATVRQLENERKLRHDSDERLKRFKAATSGTSCVDSRLPDSVINILRE